MSLLADRAWKIKYTRDDGDLVRLLYVPALECATRYDRLTGYFRARALTLAARGVEELVRAGGRMRLLVGCTLNQVETDAIVRGAEWRERLGEHLRAQPLRPANQREVEALELLAWMVAHEFLEVKVAVPCDEERRPVPAEGIFHEKAGILEDKTGDRLAFNGSLNETEAGWTLNWESLHVFCSWKGEEAAERVAAEEKNFTRLWEGQASSVITLDVPEAARADLLRFLPEHDQPARLQSREKPTSTVPIPGEPPGSTSPEPGPGPLAPPNLRRLVWGYIQHAAKLPNGGERVGEATANVTPWPHQVRAFQRLYGQWPPRLLIADEVGLGKSVQAGLLMRQAWLAGQARRMLLLAPANVCRQWQVELREKLNLSWPLYDGERLTWLKSPGRTGPLDRVVSRAAWHEEPFVIASSHLMRRAERQPELLEHARPWDLVVLDEAHHARRRAPGQATEGGPNALLRLLRGLAQRTEGLVLLTATPMQVHPVEVWDLLAALGLPSEWDEGSFLRFIEAVEHPTPSAETWEFLARLFRAAERCFGAVTEAEVHRLGATNGLQARRLLAALRDRSAIPRRQMDAPRRALARRLLRAHSPVGRLVSRHTRDLLRRYHRAGKIKTPVAERVVEDRFAPLSPAEAAIYAAVENYIQSTYRQATVKEKNAVGFVMTIYRRRLASSFAALRRTLEERLGRMRGESLGFGFDLAGRGSERADEEMGLAEPLESEGEVLDKEEVVALEQEALAREEASDVAALLESIRVLPPDTKASRLLAALEELRAAGHAQAMVFTQYTDTMDFLREELLRGDGSANRRIICFSGRGGEVREKDGAWQLISREEAKRRFREGQADVLLCTDAAAEGLNFQFCGALVNYDMPWNPMRVEQRIGRIDRLGQQFPKIRIVNLHYAETIEADVYQALRKRINLFEATVGKLQPILAQLPGRIASRILTGRGRDPGDRAALASEVDAAATNLSGPTLDLDVTAEDATADSDITEQVRPPAKLSLADLGQVLARADLLPPDLSVQVLQPDEYRYQAPGMAFPLRVTTRADYFDAHTENVELWSPGSPAFPTPEDVATPEELPTGGLAQLMG